MSKAEMGRESGASPLACALPELSHPRIQLLLISHLKDDVCPVLHLVGGKEQLCGSVSGVCMCNPGYGSSVTHL